MAKCYYCGDEVTNDDLTEIDGTYVRVCADCREFIQQYGADELDHWVYAETDVKEMKQFFRYMAKEFAKKTSSCV